MVVVAEAAEAEEGAEEEEEGFSAETGCFGCCVVVLWFEEGSGSKRGVVRRGEVV